MGLANQAAHRFRHAQAAFSMNGEGHGSHYTGTQPVPHAETHTLFVGEIPTEKCV
jgi:hypothetical protein